MPRPWYEIEPALLADIQASVEGAYPSLHFAMVNGVAVLRGSFPLTDGTEVFDRYSIEIELSDDHPRGVPRVREIGGRIPRTVDRHIIDDSGLACLFVPDERDWVYPDSATLLDFLNGPVRTFFLSQSLFEIEGKWPFGQRSHGFLGIFEFYSDILATRDVEVILHYLEFLSAKQVRRHLRCPCGSGRRLRACHREQVEKLRQRILPERARLSWQAISHLKRTMPFLLTK